MKSNPTDIRVQQTVFLKALEDSVNDYTDFKSVLGKNNEVLKELGKADLQRWD